MRRLWLVGGGMLVGGALAVFHIVRLPERPPVPEEVVAWVNGRPISMATYEQALAAVAGDRKEGVLREEDRKRVLDRLIDQELLIDRAIELGLPERDPQIRNQLATAMIDFLVTQAQDAAASPTDEALQDFYREEAFRFRRHPRFRVDHAFVAGTSEGDRRRAERLRAAEDLAEGDPAIPLPAGSLLLKEIEQRVGPSTAARIAELDVGDTAIVETPSGYHVVRLLERSEGEVPPFDEVKDLVRVAYVRAQSEKAVRDFLELARKRSDIETTTR